MRIQRLRVLIVAAALALTALPVWAGVSGSGGGHLIVNTIYKTVVNQDITTITRDELNAELSHIVGHGVVQHHWWTSCGRMYSTYDHFNTEATVSASNTANGLASVLATLNNDVFSVPGRTAAYASSEAYLGSHKVWLQPVVTSQLTGTTSQTDSSVTYTETPGAVVIGDPSDIAAVNSGGVFVVSGTVTVTDTETTVETQHITKTTTNKYNVVGEYAVGVYRLISPLVLNMNGTGKLEADDGHWLPRSKIDKSRMAFFDMHGNGFPVLMEWVGPHDGLLCRPKPDGTIDGTCLFGTATGFESGYEELATLDTNHDGVISGKELKGLCVWQDANGNAYPDKGEVKTVQQLGITSISLRQHDFKGSFTMNGNTCAMFDWWPHALELRRLKMPHGHFILNVPHNLIQSY